MQNKWNERYAGEKYFYGKEPNDFFREQVSKLTPGKILLPAEGEGRNAVFAAKKGWAVTAFDSSSMAKIKAEKLAQENNVKINYITVSFDDVTFPIDFFDCIALTYVHSANRRSNHKKLLTFLKPKGVIILEAFSKEQLKYNSGGPKDINRLFSEDELRTDFASLSNIKIISLEKDISEGSHHLGKASILRLIGIK